MGTVEIEIQTFKALSDKTDAVYACGPTIHGNLLVVNLLKGIVI